MRHTQDNKGSFKLITMTNYKKNPYNENPCITHFISI